MDDETKKLVNFEAKELVASLVRRYFVDYAHWPNPFLVDFLVEKFTEKALAYLKSYFALRVAQAFNSPITQPTQYDVQVAVEWAFRDYIELTLESTHEFMEYEKKVKQGE